MPWASACLLVLLSPSVQAFTAAPRTRSWLAAVSVAGIGLRAGLSGRQFVPALGGAKQKSHRKHGVGPVCVCVCVCVCPCAHTCNCVTADSVRCRGFTIRARVHSVGMWASSCACACLSVPFFLCRHACGNAYRAGDRTRQGCGAR